MVYTRVYKFFFFKFLLVSCLNSMGTILIDCERIKTKVFLTHQIIDKTVWAATFSFYPQCIIFFSIIDQLLIIHFWILKCFVNFKFVMIILGRNVW